MNEIPASNEIYEYIIFRGADIKDLNVIQKAAQDTQDPAIIDLGQKVEQPTQKSSYNPSPQQYKSRQERKPEPQRWTEDFNFDENNKKLDKRSVEEEKTKSYDKTSSFFDLISHGNASVKRESREDREKQRNVDSETFGESEVRNTEYEISAYNRRNRGSRGNFRRRPTRGRYRTGNRYRRN